MNFLRPILKEISSGQYHVLIIGGGITGAGIARDATLRGFKVALIEQGDYASGTSSRTSKLIHGGIRYLEQGNFSLVFEASRERQILMKLAPHLVRPIPFLFPIYKNSPSGKLKIKAGMVLYDLLSLFKNVQAHRMLDREEVIKMQPDLLSEGLVGAALYYDCQMNDARLCLENILEAKSLGAVTLNYARVIDLAKDPAQNIRGVQIKDLLSGEQGQINAEVVVNASGPWVDRICEMDRPGPPKCRTTRGSHLVLPSLSGNQALVVKSHRDQRIFFVIPWEGLSLVGTTDIDFKENPDDVYCPPEDVAYLLNEINRLFPSKSLGTKDIVATIAGVRPLISADDPKASSVSRETQIFQDPSGLISITGGKFTTYRNTSEQVVDLIQHKIPHAAPFPCRTRTKPLWGGGIQNFDSFMKEKMEEICSATALDPSQASHLISTYGTHYYKILNLLKSDKDLEERLHPSLPHTKAEVVHAVRGESAITLQDILHRRTSLGLGTFKNDETLLNKVLLLMAQELNWDPEKSRKELIRYFEEGVR